MKNFPKSGWASHPGRTARSMVIAILLVTGSRSIGQVLDSAYHDNDEILAELTAYAEAYPDWMTLDSIGHSAEFGMPIWMAKLSDNPDRIEPEAAILLVGQVHAEEVVGVEIVLEVMRQMLDNNEENLFRQRLEGLEIYLIPTANPEGLDIVHSGVDITFRKNCRDNIGDGQLRIFDGEGWDTSGVDINRNFGTHWDRGDTLFRPEETFRYNAYRGAAPFSEPESQALRDLALQRPFLFSIVYHSSRTGNSAEMLIAPWFWRENNIIKRPPDYPAINALGERLAGMLPKMRDPNDHYRPVQSMQRKGQLQDWFYVETGCIQYMAEVAADIHPDADTMRMVVADNLPAVWYLMDLALGLERLDGFGTLTVIATDAQSHRQIEAHFLEMDRGELPTPYPRRTCLENGRFDWLLPAGRHTTSIYAKGYEIPEEISFNIVDGERTVLDIALQPHELSHITFTVRDRTTGQLVPSRIRLWDWPCYWAYDLSLPDGILTIDLPAQYYSIETTAPGYLPPFGGAVFHDEVEEVQTSLSQAEMAFVEDFEDDGGWQRGGDNEDWGIVIFDGRSCLTESVVDDYPTDADIWLELNDVVALDTVPTAVRIIHMPYCEPLDDYQVINWWTNPDDVHTMPYSRFRSDWDTLYLYWGDLENLDRGMLNLKFRVVSDHAIGEDGWLIDQVAVFVEGHEQSAPQFIPHPSSFILLSAYPNPFNSSVTITYALPIAAPISLRLYNLSGREVRMLVQGDMQAGYHRTILYASDLPSGVYFMRLEGAGRNTTQKVMLMK